VNGLSKVWDELDTRRRAFLIGGLAAFVMVSLILIRVVMAPSYALLYSGLDPAAAGQVVSAIEAQGVAYRVQGDSIHVDVTQRDALRMSLAGEGLPANGAAGYELLDTLSGFGTTSQMFDAAYWRAKEGELARTIRSSPRIRAARVHIANPSADPFQPSQDVTASVALRPAAGGLGPGHAQALRYLVASSVPGLLPENVTVVDADNGQVLGANEQVSPMADAAARAEDYRRNIERLLAARVGEGNAVVQVNVELTTARETILERRIDPESRVVIATETEQRDTSATDDMAGAVTVASNLPEGDAEASDGQSRSQNSESHERVTFDMSELQREVEHGPGDIRRISVAVLLNGVPITTADGLQTVEPRPEAEIEALRSLVETAIGFDPARGDAVTIDSMAFDQSVAPDMAESGLADRISFDLGRVIQTLVLAAAALFIAFGLLRPLLNSAPSDAEPQGLTIAPPEHFPGLPTAPDSLADMPMDNDAASGHPPNLLPAGPLSSQIADANPGLPGPAAMNQVDFEFEESGELDPVERLRQLIEEREEETVEILRSWMEEDDEVQT